MSLTCEFCKKTFSSKGSLSNHQKKAKYCLEIQNKESVEYQCVYCKNNFCNKDWLVKHEAKCIKYFNLKLLEKDELISKQKENLQEKDNKNLKLQVENDLLRKQMDTLMSKNTEKECLFELQDKLKEIAMVAIEQKNETISMMVKKYVKKQPRVKYDEQNVFYILTTKLLKTDNRYIFGKAKNLTSRLSTYNKSDEHEVVFYQSCGSEEQMGNVENVVFQKLSEYREQANRERFILPLGKSVDYFVKEVINIIEFLK